MTHNTDLTNGASLEDCHTNFFALADLSGIKWRRLCADIYCPNHLEDPILISYSKCLSAGILSVWRRVAVQKSGHYDINSLSCHKELWIFWYGDEPDFGGLIKPSLTEADQGSWESGLSYECRTLLFKALHNLIERCLLSKGYARLGRYFIEPLILPVIGIRRTAIAFALNFFVHGDSTVCASVDARSVLPLYALHECHMTAALGGHKDIKVILSPFGIEGKLTGNGYKYSDPHMTQFLNEWYQFYPHPSRKDTTKMNSELQNVIEVITGGVRMKFPASYIFVSEEDHLEAFQETQSTENSSAFQPASMPKHVPTLGLLTPPLSPCEVPGYSDNSSKSAMNGKSAFHNIESPQKQVPFIPDIIKQSVSQECCTPIPSCKNEESSVLWDFQDPAAIVKCGCSRKSKKTSQRNAVQADSKLENCFANSRLEEKSRFEKFRIQIPPVPFHRQKSSFKNKSNDLWHQDHCSASRDETSVAHRFNTHGSYVMGGNFTNLPQLHTPLNQSSSSFESLPNTPSADLYFSQVTFSDPIMPTLSPQPPVIKEEDCSQSFEMQNQVNVSSPGFDVRQAVTKKEKIISEEALSPFHTSLLAMFESSKPASKTPDMRQTYFTEDQSIGFQPLTTDIQLSALPFQKPQLPKRPHEDLNTSQSAMIGPLYDYTVLNSPIWESSPTKKKRILALSVDDVCNEESDIDIDAGTNAVHMSENLSCIPKDPYEFTEFDETAPSERGFRVKIENIKEEEQFNQPCVSLPIDISPSCSPVSVPAIPPEISPTICEEIKISSPTTSKSFTSKFIRAEDLAVSLHDLDNIFDTSSSDDDSDSPAKLMRMDDGRSSSGMIELSRMYPTPPSLEQNALPSPLGTMVGIDNVISENDIFKDSNDNEEIIFYETEEVVWQPPLIYQFLESPKYASLTSIHFFNEDNSHPDFVYRPSWLQNMEQSSIVLDCNSLRENNQNLIKNHMFGNQHYTFSDVERLGPPPPYTANNNLESSCSAPPIYDIESPPSNNAISYQNRHPNNSPYDDTTGSYTLEANSLVVNLLLSDSLLNIFKDHNFESCCLCVCNMNIKGADAGVTLPASLIPSGNNEPQYKCMCGFSAAVLRHRSYNSGLFYEDELEVTGFDCDKFSSKVADERTKTIQAAHPDFIPSFVLGLLRVQCKMMHSSFSLFHKSNVPYRTDSCHSQSLNALEMHDGCEVCFLALEAGSNAMRTVPSKLDVSSKYSCLHKWPFLTSPLPSASQDVMYHLQSLKPLLQLAVHKKNTQRLWDVTYVVSGPLTWREFHQLAARGNEDQCEPQPIPSLMIGCDKDCVALSPFALKYWDKLLLEPYSLPRDVAYIVVAPENDVILSHVKNFFKELSSTYELYKLGRHSPIIKVLRDGIMRVGKIAASKVAEEPIDEWFNQIGDSPISNKLKLYARVCKHRLAPHLSTLSLDKSIFESPDFDKKHTDNSLGNLSALAFPSETVTTSVKSLPFTSKGFDIETSVESPVPVSSCPDASDEEEDQLPALVVYIVEPFTFAQCDPSIYRMVTLGLLHSYAEMVSFLPEPIRNSIHLQLLSLDSIMCMEGSQQNRHRKDQMKALAFSVYSQSHELFAHQSTVKSLTGFGLAAARDTFLDGRNLKAPAPAKNYCRPFVLASMKDKQTELGEMFGDRKQKSGLLHCAYCLTEDRRFILVSCTNDKGEFTETNVVNITIPNRSRRQFTSVRKFGLRKVLDFVLEVISSSAYPWRIIIERFGKLGHGELKAWASLLSRKSMQAYTHQLWELCGQCSISGTNDVPSILSICLVSLEPDSTLRIMSDQFTPDDHFNSSSCNTCPLSTPEDATCTHILVFPTSATTQLSQGTFQQEHIDTLPGGLGEDIFEALNDDDITVGQDINDIFGWTESPTQSPGNSPHHGDNMQPSSPGMSSRPSFHHGGMRETLISENQDEPLQLLQQPLALGYYVSTAPTGPLPKWFWSSCPQMANKSPVFLKSALLIHLPFVQQNSDDILHNNPQQQLICHPLDSNYTTDVLRYVLEGYNALSWLALDPSCRDRCSCLPIHIQMLMQLYGIVEAIL